MLFQLSLVFVVTSFLLLSRQVLTQATVDFVESNPRRCATRVKRSSNRAAYPSSGPGAGGHGTGFVIVTTGS